MDRPITIFMSAAEASGDEHAAKLIVAIREHLPRARFVGLGGPKMAEQGCEILRDITDSASMLGGPILRLKFYRDVIAQTKRAMRQIRPDVHIPVDSPALNWHLAKEAKECGSAVVYYVAPQVWAWAPWRVKKLARLTDHVACILPFEEEYLRSRGVKATFVGHPLFDDLPSPPWPPPDIEQAWADGTWKVALLPGSRPSEIKAHAVAMGQVARAITDRWPKAQCVFSARTESDAEKIRELCRQAGLGDVEIACAATSRILAESHFAIAASGTVTLQVAHFGVPMVVVYRVGRIGWNLVGRWLLQTPYLSLVNILAGRELVPELMPWSGNVKQIIRTAMDVMDDVGWLVETRRELLRLVAPLHVSPPRSASANTAGIVVETLLDRRGKVE